MRLSPHFTLAELVVTEVRPFQRINRAAAERVLPTLRSLAELLEEVRALLGHRPIIVHSAYRFPELNHAIGGAPSSQHTKGEAADFHVHGMDLREAFDILRRSDLKFGQLILEDGDGDGVPTWIHISLGAPWRDPTRCQQVLEYDGKVYRRV